jgi:hypothetical protein
MGSPAVPTISETRALKPKRPTHKDVEVQLADETWLRVQKGAPAVLVVLSLAWPVVRGPVLASRVTLAVYVALYLIVLLRWFTALAMVKNPERVSPAVSYGLLLGGALANGLGIGIYDLLLYRQLEPLALGIWMTCIAGIAGSATVSLGARPPVFFAYAMPAMGAFALAPILWPRELASVIAGCILVWIAYAFLQVWQYGKSRKEFVLLHLELDAKVKLLDANNAELGRKNQELEAMSQRADRIFAALGDALPGKVLAGKYLLESRIGTGGFAIVFRATHVGIGRPLAVKIFRPQAGNDTGASLERFRYEGMASGRIRHPNIVDVIDAGISDDGIPYIAMELLHGNTLERELSAGEGKRLPLARIARIMEQVCLGLAAAHEAKVIHRDVKPENIFLHRDEGDKGAGEAETVKLLDFGIAKVLDPDQVSGLVTSTGDLLGTPYYMAPERFVGRECDASADVYSVGLILYRALAGRLPFQGTVAEIMFQTLSKRPPHIRDRVPDLPPEVGNAIMQSLAEAPDERPTAKELAATLARAAADARQGVHAA